MLKTVSSITNAIGAVNYKGTWNASTNTPTLASGVGIKGDYYLISVTGSTSIDGIATWGVGDSIVFNGTTWQRMEGGSNGEFVDFTASGIGKIGTTNQLGSSKLSIRQASISIFGDGICIQDGSDAFLGGYYISFMDATGNKIGKIERNGLATVNYATSSDYRLKSDVQPMSGALDRLSRLKPVTFKWKDGTDGEGFIAHELQEVCPQAVTGKKDATYEVGSLYKDGVLVQERFQKPHQLPEGYSWAKTGTAEDYQGIDTSNLVALLTASVLELMQEVKSLKSKLEGV